MRNFIEGTSAGYAVTFLGAFVAGIPWDKVASILTAIWFFMLIIEKVVSKVKAWWALRHRPVAT